MPISALRSVVFLSGEAEASALCKELRHFNPDLQVQNAPTREALDLICESIGSGVRLISFCSPVVVPAKYLRRFDCGSYNFHPGPPSYPGRYPSVFALYEDAKNFGITVHEMKARVDEGAIVAASWFAIPPQCDLETLDTLAFKALVQEFRRLARHLASDAKLIPTKPIGWSGKKRTKADCDDLCTITPSLSGEERAKRVRACGPHVHTPN